MLKKLLFLSIINIFLINVSYAESQQKINFFVKQFSIQGSNPLNPEEIKELLKPYEGQQYDLKQLKDVAKVLEQKIHGQGFSFYRVTLPPQTLTNETIELKIIPSVVNKIEVEGHHYFDEKNIRASVSKLKTGESPNTDSLADDLKVANQHLFKNLKLTFKKSDDDSDKIDAKITVKEKRPYQASLLINNMGTDKTKEFRLTGMVQYGNLWNLDHQISASYTTSPEDVDTVQQYGVSYRLPIYALKGWLRAYYVFSNVDNGLVANDFSITGSGEMYGLYYQQFLPRLGRYEHSLDIGIDNRFFINNIKFLEIPIGNSVRSVPVSILYRGKYPWNLANVDFYVQWVGNTDLGGHNNPHHYQNSRFNAQQDWHLLRYDANLSVRFKQWLFKARLTGQYSDQPLIAGEQLGLGGTYSIRGYNERETSADTGEIVKLELHTPSWYGFNLLTFYDYGHGRQQSTLSNETKSWTLSSVGIGGRWRWSDHIFASVDFAHALNEGIQASGTHIGTNRIHAGLVLRF